MTTVRSDIVALLLDIDFDKSAPPDHLVHMDGRPFTAWETHRVGEAQRPEFESARQFAETAMDFHESKLADANRMEELLGRYAAGLPGTTPISQVRALMTAAEQAELDEILGRAAPDGNLLLSIPGGGR